MSVSFCGYVRNGNDLDFPPEISKRLPESIMPAHGTPEFQDWYNGEGDQSRFSNPDYDPRLTVNLNQRNARYVLNELGFLADQDGELSGVMALDSFVIGVSEAIRRLGNEREPGFGSYIERTPGRMISINCGILDGYLNDRLASLLRLAEAAKEYGATLIGWD
jgi:hypothetical protein